MTFQIAPQVLQFRPGQSIFVTARSTSAIGNNPFQLKLLNNVFEGFQTDASGNKVVQITIPELPVGSYTLSGISALDGTQNVAVKIPAAGTDTTLQPAAIFQTWRVAKYTHNEGGAPNPSFVTVRNVSSVTGRFRVSMQSDFQDITLAAGQSQEVGFSRTLKASFSNTTTFSILSLDAGSGIVGAPRITFAVVQGKSPPGEIEYWTPGDTNGGGGNGGSGSGSSLALLALLVLVAAFAGGAIGGRSGGKRR